MSERRTYTLDQLEAGWDPDKFRRPRLKFCWIKTCGYRIPLEDIVCPEHELDAVVVCGCGLELAVRGQPMRYQAPPEHGCRLR